MSYTRRKFISQSASAAAIPFLAGAPSGSASPIRGAKPEPVADRQYWVDLLVRITSPVLESLSVDKIRERMPVEAQVGLVENRKKVTYLEALGRSLVGLAPWLELGVDGTAEGKIREKILSMAHASIRHAVNPSSSSYMNFTEGRQPLVDAAFLAHSFVRAPQKLWKGLSKETRTAVISAFRTTRSITPYYSNWLLFSAMIETALAKFGEDADRMRIDYAIRQHESWYLGDGVYGDGPHFHFDYYNSFVIHPMLVDITATFADESDEARKTYHTTLERAVRHAAIQERMISPEGTFPPVGRSLAYRCGAFQLLSQIALMEKLPDSLQPAQVRCALTALIKRTIDIPGTFDENGWLTIGLAGHQPGIGESYISTGSLYLCSAAFLGLGLPTTNKFWSDPAADWTSKAAFSGKNFPIDKAVD